jgi:hypothetical protein
MLILNVSNPANPVEAGEFGTSGAARDIKIFGNYAYVAESWTSSWGQGTQIINICDPTSPVLAGEFNTPGDAYAIAVSDDKIYIADTYSFIILQSNLTSNADEETMPSSFSLSQNYPNPFNASTSISYNLPAASNIKLDIFDLLGRKIESLFNGYQESGPHNVIWNSADAPSGVYFYRLEAGKKVQTNKMVLMK